MLVARARCNSITCKFNSKAQDNDSEIEVSRQATLNRARKGIRGNVMVSPLNVMKMNQVIPPSPDTIRDTMCAIFVGNSLPSRAMLSKYSPVLVRKSRVKKMIMFLLDRNPHYMPRFNFHFSEQNLDSLFEHEKVEEGVPNSVHIGLIPANNAINSATSDYTYRNVDNYSPDDDNELLMENVGYTDGDDSPASFLAMKSEALQRCLQGKPFIASGRGSRLVPDFHNPSVLTWLFPHLDPWGIGGFYHPGRTVKISMEEQLAHLLMVDDSPFEKDPEFAFIFYNICRKATVSNGLRFSVSQKQHQSVAEQLLKVDPEVLATLNEKTQANSRYQPTDKKEKELFNLLSSLRMMAKHVPGSDGYKMMRRNEIRSLINYRGAPTLFVTLNPSDVDNPIVRILAGDDISLEDMSRGEDMSEWNRKLFAAKNPSACARFFDVMITKFIKIILRFGRETDGVYGKCEAYYGVVEAQGKGTLHLHMLVWLKGHPSPQVLRHYMDASHLYKTKVFEWLNSVIKCEFPGSPSCELQRRNHPRRMVHRELGDPHPGVLPLLSLKGYENDETQFWMEFEQNLISLLYQYAWHIHQATCFKYLSRSQEQNDENCRMGMNGDTREESTIDPDTNALILRRRHPKIAAHTDVVTVLMKCNMDVKFVGSGEAAKAFIYYVTDYITKPSLSVHVGMSALAYAVKKTNELVSGNKESQAEGKRAAPVVTAVNSMMSRQEISHPQVMSYIVGGGDYYTSEKFRPLQWTAVRKFVHAVWSRCDQTEQADNVSGGSEEPNVALIFGEKEITASNQQLDYTWRARNEAFEDICLYDFVAFSSKVRYTAEQIRKGETNRPGSFLKGHPQHGTHYLSFSRNRAVPVLLGPSIPNPKRSDELKEEWARDMLTLFKPWRDPLTLKSPEETWSEAFDDYRNELPELYRRIMANMLVLTECGEARDNHARQRRSRSSTSVQEQDPLAMISSDELLMDLDPKDIPSTDAFGLSPDLNRVGDEDLIVADTSHILSEESSRLLNMCVFPDVAELDDTDLLLTASKITNDDRTPMERQISAMNSKKKRKRLEDDTHEERSTVRQRTSWPIATRAILSDDREKRSDKNDMMRVADDIAAEMRLGSNREQMLAFSIIARHVIEGNGDQLLMHVAGVGGTGKSHVVKAVVMLFERLARRQELLLGAPTGIAAVLIGGQTLHSLIQATPHSKSRDVTSLARIWRRVRYLIIDEVSMLGARFLSQFSSRVRIGKGDDTENNRKPFGGVNVIFMGDFGQLKPPKQFALYAQELVDHPSFAESRNEKGISAMNGAFLWRQVTKVVELVRNQRHANDPTYAGFLNRLRLAECVDSDLEYLKSRLLENQADKPQITLEFQDAPIVVGSKSLRDLLNGKLVKYHAARQRSELRTYYSKDYVSKTPVGGEVQRQLWSLPSSVNREAFGELSLFIGMKVMVTENLAFDDNIVNGSEGIVREIKFVEDSNGRRYASVVHVHIPGCGVHIEGLEEDIVPIFPVSARIEYSGSVLQAKGFVRKQIPLVPAYAYTDFKSQGRTLEKVIVDLRTARGQGVYVMLSRVKSLSGLLILRWFPPNKIFHRLSQELRSELRRLRVLTNETAV